MIKITKDMPMRYNIVDRVEKRRLIHDLNNNGESVVEMCKRLLI
jgi:hypothetical protein